MKSLSIIAFPMLMIVVLLVFLFDSIVIKPWKTRRILSQQGISGPSPTILLGNILEIKKYRNNKNQAMNPPVMHHAASVFSFLEQWRKQYGMLYTFSLGKMQILYVSDPELVKEITTCTSPDLGRPAYQQKELGPLLGQGILTSNGLSWAHQRKIMAPELFLNKVKGMMGIITESALSLVNSWKDMIIDTHDGVVLEILVDGYMKKFSGEVISRACFGSSYSRGQDQDEFLSKFRHLQQIISKTTLSLGIPGLRYLPTRNNRRVWALEKEIRVLILNGVKNRQRSGAEKDLLQILLEGAQCSSYFTSETAEQFVVDNCRNIYLAGFETSAVSASWCLMLLASNPEWQDRIRAEVHQVCQGNTPNFDMLRRMKQLNMVIQETMRLYPPSPTLSREAQRDMIIGGIRVPKGVNIWTMVAAVHTDQATWGLDALEFKPERFKNGIAGACKNPSSYMPFGFGQRVCMGQHLAMLELKLLLSLIVSTFSFTLSPNYVHCPVMNMLVEPNHGVKILVQKV